VTDTYSSARGGRRIEVGEVIDQGKFFPLPFSIAIMMIIIMLTDGFDLFTMGYVGPRLIEDWGVTGADLGPVNMAGLIGMAIGSVSLGWAGDKIGRKKAYVACLALLFVGSMLCFFAQNLWQLTTFRLITGLGLGGVTPLATTLIAEWTSKSIRSVVVATVIVAVPLGGTLAGFVNDLLVPTYGWRSMFFVGAVAPLVLFALFSFTLPESPKYMARHPHMHKKLANWLNRLVREKRFDGSEDFYVADTAVKDATPVAPIAGQAGRDRAVGIGVLVLALVVAVSGAVVPGLSLMWMIIAGLLIALVGAYYLSKNATNSWFATIWSKHYRVTTILIWVAFAMNSFVLYLYTNYLPTLAENAGWAPETASATLRNFSLGAFFGSIGGAVLIGLFGSRKVGTLLAFLGVIASGIIGVLMNDPSGAVGVLLALCLIGGASVNGMQAFMYAVSANAYPTEVRGSAVGMAQTFSRIGAVASPAAATVYFGLRESQGMPISTFLFFIGACALVTTLSFLAIPTHIAKGDRQPGLAVGFSLIALGLILLGIAHYFLTGAIDAVFMIAALVLVLAGIIAIFRKRVSGSVAAAPIAMEAKRTDGGV
jgi:AAHS family 4-hydroxybenzoate transporter-like MFS transporter